jgi:hypothetical protein
LLALINIGSPVALDDILSMAISSIYLTYLMASVLLLHRRIKGDISPYNDNLNESDIVNVPRARLVWGPFHCNGLLGKIANAFAIVYITMVVFLSFWPSASDPGIHGAELECPRCWRE